MDREIETSGEPANADEALDIELRAVWTAAPAAPPALRTKILSQLETPAAAAADSRGALWPRTYRGPIRSTRARTAWAAGAAMALFLFGARFALRSHRPHPSEITAAGSTEELSDDDEKFALALSGDEVDLEDQPSLLDVVVTDE